MLIDRGIGIDNPIHNHLAAPESPGFVPRSEGLEAGRQQEAAALAVRLLTRRLASLDIASRERLSSLALQQLEQLAEDLLDFSVPGHLRTWFVKFRAPTAPRQTATSQQPRVKKQLSVKSLRD